MQIYESRDRQATTGNDGSGGGGCLRFCSYKESEQPPKQILSKARPQLSTILSGSILELKRKALLRTRLYNLISTLLSEVLGRPFRILI